MTIKKQEELFCRALLLTLTLSTEQMQQVLNKYIELRDLAKHLAKQEQKEKEDVFNNKP